MAWVSLTRRRPWPWTLQPPGRPAAARRALLGRGRRGREQPCVCAARRCSVASSCVGYLEDMPQDAQDRLEVDPTKVLPLEIMQAVLQYLDTEHLIRAGQVSQRWRRVAKSPQLWGAVDLRLDPEDNNLVQGADPANDAEEADADADPEDLYDENILRESPYERVSRRTRRRAMRQHPTVRKYFRILVAAPCLRTLEISSESFPELFAKTILEAPSLCQVRHLYLYNSNDYLREFHLKLLQKLDISELSIFDLNIDCVPILDHMKTLKVLRFSVAQQADAASQPVFPSRRRPGEPSSLERVLPMSYRRQGYFTWDKDTAEWRERTRRAHAYQGTIRSLVQAYASSLQEVSLVHHLKPRMLRALSACRALHTLHLPLQPGLGLACRVPPALRHLVVRMPRKWMKHRACLLDGLPPNVTQLTLELRAGSQIHMQDEAAAVAARCGAMTALASLCLVFLHRHRDAPVAELELAEVGDTLRATLRGSLPDCEATVTQRPATEQDWAG